MGEQISIKGTAKPGRQKQYKSQAAKQKAYRRRCELSNKKKVIQVTLSIDEYYVLERLAAYCGSTKSVTIGKVLVGSEKELLKNLDDKQKDTYHGLE